MIPKAFLSLAGEDADFVDRVYRHLPHGQAFYFKQSFANGNLMLEAMEREVAGSQLFILFASKTSLQKTWVKFEISQARLAQILGTQKRLQIYAADDEISAADLPEWMRAYWLDTKARNARDIARSICHQLDTLIGTALPERMYGRGILQDELRRRFNTRRKELKGQAPNIILGSGIHQIGRETFIKATLPLLFPALPNIASGPILDLPIWSELKDVYRGIREIVEDPFDLGRYQEDLTLLDAMSPVEQVEELTRSMEHFVELGEAVIIRAASFLYDSRGTLRGWVRDWFAAIARRPGLIVGFVSNRQLPAEDEVLVSHVCQIPVGSLPDDDVRLIIDDLAAELGLATQSPSPELLIQIGGHPVLARAYVRLAEQYGSTVFERSPTKLFTIQDGILQDNLDASKINRFQKEILHTLSWLPKLDGFTLEQVCVESADERLPYNESLNDLILGCLVEVKDASFSISGAVRALFRRRFGYGSEKMLTRLAALLATQMEEADKAGAVRSDLVDAIIYMYVLTGKAMPPQFKRLLLPSTLEALVRDAYNSGRENEESYDLAIKWGLGAENMQMDEGIREEILSSVVRAYVRKEEFEEADKLLAKFDQRDYRSRFFLRGFRLMKEGDPKSAIAPLSAAIKERRYRGSSINQLGIAYFQTGNIGKLEDLLKSNANQVERSAFLLDLRAQLSTAEGDYQSAERDIQLLVRLPEDHGRSVKRRAIIMAKRDKDYAGAVRLVESLIEGVKGKAIPLHFLRGMLAAKGVDRRTAMAEAEFVRAHARRSGSKQYLKIVARLAVAERNWRTALEALDRVGQENVSDRYLRADALRLKADDVSVGLADREKARVESYRLVGGATAYSDLDFSDDDGPG